MGVVVTFVIPDVVAFEDRQRVVSRVAEAIKFATEKQIGCGPIGGFASMRFEDLRVTALPR